MKLTTYLHKKKYNNSCYSNERNYDWKRPKKRYKDKSKKESTKNPAEKNIEQRPRK